MKHILAVLAIILFLTGCGPEQRANCAFCRFVSGQGWTCEPAETQPAPASKPAAEWPDRLKVRMWSCSE